MTPRWLLDLLGIDVPAEGEEVEIGGRRFRQEDGILRQLSSMSESQAQTADAFRYKWHRRRTFESAASLESKREWLVSRYGDVSAPEWWADLGESPLVVDAGCGAGMTAIELFGPRLRDVRYLGIDVSGAIDVAADRFAERELEGGFLQADLADLPLRDGSVDVILAEGVLHHTDSTEQALHVLVPLLKPGGRLLFYVYRRKGPLREFTDDYIREKLQPMASEEAWDALLPLSKLGRALGELDVKLDVPEDIDLLEIPAGTIDLQRFFYWHVCKAFYRPDFDLEEMNHINYDWFAPRNAHRQTPDDVREWCRRAGLVIERERVEEAGLTIVARAGS